MKNYNGYLVSEKSMFLWWPKYRVLVAAMFSAWYLINCAPWQSWHCGLVPQWGCYLIMCRLYVSWIFGVYVAGVYGTTHSVSLAAPNIWNSLPPSLCTCTSSDILIPSVVISRPTTARRPSNPLNPSLLAPQIRLLLTVVHVYKLYLLTFFWLSCTIINYKLYLLTYFRWRNGVWIECPRPRGRPKRTWWEVVERTVRHVNWTSRMRWIVANGGCLMSRMGVSGWMFFGTSLPG